ncbi:MAG: 8-oxo-dGTP diphosphatase [Mycobacterium sp.]|nr:8-oxo-dGTP diphosphatase [Mycobacterium sp.]
MPGDDPRGQSEATGDKIVVVAGALIAAGRVLVAQRARPPELAGQWELPGGKVGPEESEKAALARELAEELGVDVTVGSRLGADVALSDAMTLRAYLVTQTCDRRPVPHDHRALRWVAPTEFEQLDWVPADRAWLPGLAAALASTASRRESP